MVVVNGPPTLEAAVRKRFSIALVSDRKIANWKRYCTSQRCPASTSAVRWQSFDGHLQGLMRTYRPELCTSTDPFYKRVKREIEPPKKKQLLGVKEVRIETVSEIAFGDVFRR